MTASITISLPAKAAMRQDSVRQTGSKARQIGVIATIQMRWRVNVFLFFERKRRGECSVHSQIPSLIVTVEPSNGGEDFAVGLRRSRSGILKKESTECAFLLAQDAFCDSHRTCSAIFSFHKRGRQMSFSDVDSNASRRICRA